jgi:hypothetical protein
MFCARLYTHDINEDYTMHYFRTDLRLVNIKAEDWGLNAYDGNDLAAQRLSSLAVTGISKLETLVTSGTTIETATRLVYRELKEEFQKPDLAQFGADEDLTNTTLLGVLEDFVEKRYGVELEPFWERGD